LSDTDWLDVVGVKYLPNSARIHIRVPSAPLLPGQRLGGKVTVISNGNQRFEVEVALQLGGKVPLVQQAPPPQTARSSHQPPPVRRPGVPVMPVEIVEAPVASARLIDAEPLEEAVEAVPVLEPYEPPPPPPPPRRPEPPPIRGSAAGPSQPPPAPEPSPAPSRSNPLLHLIGPIIILLALLGAVLHDFLLPAESEGQDLLDSKPRLSLKFLDGEPPKDKIGVPPEIMSFGVTVADLDGRGPGKRLMYDDKGFGRTNNVCVKIDGQEYLFGYPKIVIQEGRPMQAAKPVGAWLKKSEPLGTGRIGTRSTWRIGGLPPGDLGIDVTQTVELVAGEQSRLLDTVLVRYEIVNAGGRAREVGIRFLLDTYIGANDGVPFTIPGRGGLCATSERFEGDSVPNYIQAVENPDLSKPGTIAHLQFRTSLPLEVPSRVLLGGYPDKPLQEPPVNEKRANGWLTGWDVPFVSIHEVEKIPAERGKAHLPDSAVTIYWDAKKLAPNEKRDVGFTYGLGELASDDGRLALTVGGQTVRGGEFSLTALRREPKAGEHLTLRLPPGDKLELLSPAEQQVPKVEAGSDRPVSTVTWRVRGRRRGQFPVVVESSEGIRQTKLIRIVAPRTGVLD